MAAARQHGADLAIFLMQHAGHELLALELDEAPLQDWRRDADKLGQLIEPQIIALVSVEREQAVPGRFAEHGWRDELGPREALKVHVIVPVGIHCWTPVT